MSTHITRRDALKLATLALVPKQEPRQGVKKVIVAGAGIGGLSCAWELMRRGHDVSVLEASARTGGHVFTFREGLDDGLYADGGAEHFTQPGYEKFWSYVREFNLPFLYYPRREHLLRWIDGRMYTPEMLADPKALGELGLTEDKAFAIGNVPYYHDTRVIFQSRSRFWQRDGISPNMQFGETSLGSAWSASEEVKTARGLLAGTASGAGTAERALVTYKKYYPGRSEDIEKTNVVVWALDPWASACERTSYAPGQLAKFWPILIEPHGRIHFVGAYADNLNWGMEAATRSANRVAEAIHNL